LSGQVPKASGPSIPGPVECTNASEHRLPFFCGRDCPDIGAIMIRPIRPVVYVTGWGFADGQSRSFDVMDISRPDGLGEIANLG
jgi:hypothetical protein